MNNGFVELITYPIKVRNAFKCTTPQAVLMCIYLFHTYTVYCFSKTHSGIYMSFYPSWMDHDDIIKWKHFPRYWPFVRGVHRLLVNSPHKGQWRGSLMISLICAWTNSWINNWDTGDLRCHRAHYDITVMHWSCHWSQMARSTKNCAPC